MLTYLTFTTSLESLVDSIQEECLYLLYDQWSASMSGWWLLKPVSTASGCIVIKSRGFDEDLPLISATKTTVSIIYADIVFCSK